MKIEKHITIGSTDKKSVDLISSEAGLAKSAVKQAMSKGAVWLQRGKQVRRLRRASTPLYSGDQLHLYYEARILEQTPPPPLLIADEDAYSVWFKPYGMLSQGSKWGDHCTINRWVEVHLQPQRPAFIVNRLDRAASGLMIIAHGKRTAAYFSRLFRERQIEKRYRALVIGRPPQHQTIDTALDGRPSISHVHNLRYRDRDNLSLVEIHIETGRKHQIRRHLAGAGYPVVGDRHYGAATNGRIPDLQLTCTYLSFISPIDNLRHTYSAPEERQPSLDQAL